MSEYADDATEGAVNIHGSVMEPAAPVASEYETEAPEHEPDELDASYAERLAELEGEQATPEYVEGVRDAARALGIVEPVEPGEPGYEQYVRAEQERLQTETRQILDQIGRYVEASGDPHLEALAVELGQNILTARQEAAYEAQAQAEEAQYEAEARLDRGEEVFHEVIESTMQAMGLEEGGVATQDVADIASETYRQVAERYGSEVADELAGTMIEHATISEGNEVAEKTAENAARAEKLAKAFGNKAAPAEVIDLATSLYQRELWNAGGDSRAAVQKAMLDAVKTASGFSETTQPVKIDLADAYVTMKGTGRAPEPEPRPTVQMRDARGRFTTSGTTPIAAKYAAPPPKSPAQVRTDAQKEAIKQAFQHLGGNAVESWRNR